MPAGCGLGQIKSLIHEGGWIDGWMVEGWNRKSEQRRERGEEMSGEKRKKDSGRCGYL